jgi:hypothetical protein
VVSTPLKNISQLGGFFPIYGKIKHVPNHQPVCEDIMYCLPRHMKSLLDVNLFLPSVPIRVSKVVFLPMIPRCPAPDNQNSRAPLALPAENSCVHGVHGVHGSSTLRNQASPWHVFHCISTCFKSNVYGYTDFYFADNKKN